jgi:oxygen-independent coproporphyrinogen-3 oxidase
MAGLYIHIPFCTQKCIYCDFLSGTNLSLREQFIEALIAEMDCYHDFFKKDKTFKEFNSPLLTSRDK